MSKNLIAFTTSELVPQRFIEFAWFCLLHELHSARFWPWRTACSAEAMLSAHVRAVCEDTEMQESNAIQRVETKLRWFDLVCFCRLQRSWGHGVHFRSIFFERSSRTQSVKKQQSASTTEVFMPLPSSTISFSLEIFPKERVPMAAAFFFSKECAIGQAGAGTAEGQRISNQEIRWKPCAPQYRQDLQPSGLAVAIKNQIL